MVTIIVAITQNLGSSCDQDVDDFLISCNKILDQYVPRKNVVIRNGKIVWKHGPYC